MNTVKKNKKSTDTKKKVEPEAVTPEITYTMIPDYDSVILKELDKERITAGGIYIPDSVDLDEGQDIRMGVIVAFGPASNPNRPFLHNVGDTVFFGQLTGRYMEFEGENYTFLRHLDLFGRVNKEVKYPS